jgi:carboxylesterase
MSRRPECDFRDDVCQPFYLEGTPREGSTHGVLLLHGFTGTVAHLRPIADALHREGFTVMGINLPGHACTMDEMAACTWMEWLNAAKDAFWRLKEKCDHVSVVGLSMGGCLALILGEQMHPTAIAPISAPMGTQLPLWLATLVRPVLPTIWWKPRKEAAIPVDKRYDYGYSGFRSSSARHLSRLIRMSRRDLHAVTCPVLVVQSHADDAITPDSANVILQGISSHRKGTLWLEDVPHVCTITREADHIAAALGKHFRMAENG